MTRRLLCVALVFLFTLCSRADDQTSALINQALDKNTPEMTIDALLPGAMDKITEQTGVPLKADPAIWDLLPWGRETSIKAKIPGQPLRDTLDAITRKLGLRWEMKNDVIMIEPMHALQRLARRATKQELGCLDTLMGIALDKNGTMTIKELLDDIDAKLAASKTQYVVERPSPDVATLDAKVDVPRNSTALDALNRMSRQTPLTWYPWGRSAVVLPKTDQIRRQLGRTITASYNGADITQVLTDLSQKAGVRFEIEAGAIMAIPPESRHITLRVADTSIQEALDSLRGVSGLDYKLRDDSVYVWNNTPAAAQKDRGTLLMPIPGTNINVIVLESEVPADVREFIKAKKAQGIDVLRQLMRDENFKPPTTAPTTKPSKPEDTAL